MGKTGWQKERIDNFAAMMEGFGSRVQTLRGTCRNSVSAKVKWRSRAHGATKSDKYVAPSVCRSQQMFSLGMPLL